MKKLMVWGTLAMLLVVFLAPPAVAGGGKNPVKKVMSVAERQGLVNQAEALKQDFVASTDRLKAVLTEAALMTAEMFESKKITEEFFQSQNEKVCQMYDTISWQAENIKEQNFSLTPQRDIKLWIKKLQVEVADMNQTIAAMVNGRQFREKAFFSLAKTRR